LKHDEEAPTWAAATGVGILVILLGSIGLVAAGGWTWFSGFLVSSASGWVQAIGSVGAIATSIWLVGRQAHNDRMRALENATAERLRYIGVAFELTSGVTLVAQTIAEKDFPRSDETFDSMEADLGALVNALAAIDVTRLDGHDQIEGVLSSLGAARRLLTDIDNARRSDFDSFLVMQDLRRKAAAMGEIMDSRAKRLRIAWRAAGGQALEESETA